MFTRRLTNIHPQAVRRPIRPASWGTLRMCLLAPRRSITSYPIEMKMKIEDCLGQPKTLSEWARQGIDHPGAGFWLLNEDQFESALTLETPMFPITLDTGSMSDDDYEAFQNVIDKSHYSRFLNLDQLEDVIAINAVDAEATKIPIKIKKFFILPLHCNQLVRPSWAYIVGMPSTLHQSPMSDTNLPEISIPNERPNSLRFDTPVRRCSPGTQPNMHFQAARLPSPQPDGVHF